MKRAYPITAALVVASLGSLWALKACARDAEQPVRVAATNPAESVGKWAAGTNYTLLPTPQPTNVKPGKVEVNEFFWYGCGHCYALDPALESWQQKKPAYIEFARVPVMWGPMHQQHAKLYYTLQALNRADLHAKVFDAIHKDHNMLAAQTDAEARVLHQAFFEANGVSAKDFSGAYDSMTVATNVQRAHEVTYRYGISSVPLVSVNGKYMTDVTMAGGAGPLMNVINDLAASEKKR
jgi:protein dithiol oxidoreductase (disulfide-forming)